MAPAASTPGSARMRSSARAVYDRSALSSGYRAARGDTRPVSTCSAVNPGSTPRSCRKLASSSPAPMRRTNASATCATTSAPRTARAPRPAVPVRLSSRSTTLRLTPAMCMAGTAPTMTPSAAARPRMKRTTTASMRISWARGMSASPSDVSAPRLQNPSARPSASADERQQHRLGDELTDDARPGRAQRVTRGDLLHAARWRARARDW